MKRIHVTLQHALPLLILSVTALCWRPLPATANTPPPEEPAEPPPATTPVRLSDFKLVGDLSDDRASFVLTGIATVEDRSGGTLELLRGAVALTEPAGDSRWHTDFQQDRYTLNFERAGRYPIQVKFDAAVREHNGWRHVDFQVAPSAVQQVILQGLGEETQFDFARAGRPERLGSNFVTYLPSDGRVNLSWKQERPEEVGRLFYASELLSQVTVSPGLMTQVALLDFNVMQGEMDEVTVLIQGGGEVTRVQGADVLSWQVTPVPNSPDRRMVIRLNAQQKDVFTITVHTQTPLGAFPQSTDVLRLLPEGATRFAGYHRIINEGAVRLEVIDASGLSQIAPEQFPESDQTKAAFVVTGSQRFVYRFSGPDFSLRIQADNILPELGVSQVLSYHLGETETTIDAEIELDIREAPVRELLIRFPAGYAIAQLTAPGSSDYFQRPGANGNPSELRLVYNQPISGRQLISLRLEHNEAFQNAVWTLPRVDVVNARSTRGHVGISADAGFRLTPERKAGLTETATAFFPKQRPGLQAGFRLSDPAWSVAVRIERLPQTVQAEAFHLFSIGEGVAYGSSTMNFLVSGAPISTFHIALSDEFFNVEFAGKDLRNWQKTDGGYLVHLHTPVAGAYTLLATYERPFQAQGETLAFAGAHPLDAQTEQGHTIVISAYQFRVEPAQVSSGLLALEPAEVPSEYRLFFDTPILAAYRYTSRPFDLQLELSPLEQGETVSLVVDRASLVTRISKEGQVVTDATYFVKNRGNPHLRLALPVGVELWSATVNGESVVPVTDQTANLIPLPQHTNPDALLRLDLKLAARSETAHRVEVAAPIVQEAPVLLAEWKLEPDTGQRLNYRKGSLTPAEGIADPSGFAGLTDLYRGPRKETVWTLTLATVLLLAFSLGAWRWGSGPGIRRFGVSHITGALIGILAFALLTAALTRLARLAWTEQPHPPAGIVLLAPVQQPGSALTVEVDNVSDQIPAFSKGRIILPLALALLAWGFSVVTTKPGLKPLGWVLGWTLLAWGALGMSNGAPALFGLAWLFLLVQVAVPGIRRILTVRPAPSEQTTPATAVVTPLLLATVLLGTIDTNASDPAEIPPATAESVEQQIRVEDNFAFGKVRIRWRAQKDQVLPILTAPGVLTALDYPRHAVELVPDQPTHQFRALRNGTHEIELEYQTALSRDGETYGLPLNTQRALVNKVRLELVGQDVDIVHHQAVSLSRTFTNGNTVAEIVFAPHPEAWLGWKPRSRDASNETAVFYAELQQFFVPSAGVIEGLHHVVIRPAQGEVGELRLDVPDGATITDVIGALHPLEIRPEQSIVSVWRFDPDTRQLRIQLASRQSGTFALAIRSQVATGPLPFAQTVGLLSVRDAAGEIGLVGIGSGSEVQLNDVNADRFTPINLDDFPGAVVTSFQPQVTGLTLRRAFRYEHPEGSIELNAAAVEPDVRVTSQETLSLGEDRVVLAVNASVNITRAGIFRLRFTLPDNLDVESVSGDALSHWTELKTGDERIITLHLAGKTLGQHQFNISLTGPGITTVASWDAPHFRFLEATKQQGQLVVVPEQGMRLQVVRRTGLTQLDPQRAGIRERGVLAFRLLQADWHLALEIEQVDAWVQVTGWQHFNVNEAQVKVAANLRYTIENTGLKSFRLLLPLDAESVHIVSEQLADFLPSADPAENGFQAWDIKLHRRVIGDHLLQVTYQLRVPEQAASTTLLGVRAADVNLQRGYVTVQSEGRLQVRIDTPPAELQPAEWQSIPRPLQKDMGGYSANYTFRLVNPTYQLPLTLFRHDAAKLLPARVNNIVLTSVISDEGVMLTKVRMTLTPGDKRLLQLTLPAEAQFWFSFVNDNGTWPWREGERILIPLQQQSRDGQPVPVEFFYSSRIGSPGRDSLNLAMHGPEFDLPLENISWQVYLNDKWKLRDWAGTLQLEDHRHLSGASSVNVTDYLAQEARLQQEQTQAAEEWLNMGNQLLQRGDPQQARAAFRNAYGLSQNNAAFNEDARVQLNNLRVQQALMGLNFKQADLAGKDDEMAEKLRELKQRKDAAYTQEEARQIFDANRDEDNANFTRLARRIIEQQDAAVSPPAAIRATIPEQGRLLTFRRSVQVDKWADMNLQLHATATHRVSSVQKLGVLSAIFLSFAAFVAGSQAVRQKEKNAQ